MLDLLKTLNEEWLKVKNAPCPFILCTLIGIVIGGCVIFFIYANFVLPAKDAHISLLQEEKDSLQSALQKTLTDEQKQIHSADAKIDTKQDIRTFLESLNPAILAKVDIHAKKVGVWLGPVNQVKLISLSDRPDFGKFLSIEKTERIWMVAGEGQLGDFIRPIGENGSLVGYYLHPKDALIK